MKPRNWNWVGVLLVVISLAAGIGSYLWREQQDASLPSASASLSASDMEDVSAYAVPIPQGDSSMTSSPTGGGKAGSTTAGTPSATASATAPLSSATSQGNDWEQHIATPSGGSSSATVPSAPSYAAPSPSYTSPSAASSPVASSPGATASATASPAYSGASSGSTAPSGSAGAY